MHRNGFSEGEKFSFLLFSNKKTGKEKTGDRVSLSKQVAEDGIAPETTAEWTPVLWTKVSERFSKSSPVRVE